MTEPIPLRQLAIEIEPLPEGIDIPTGLIARIEPQQLQYSINDAIVRGLEPKSRFIAVSSYPKREEGKLEELLNQPSSFSQRKEARKRLERALAEQQVAQEQYEIIEPEMDLAYDTDERVLKLSRPHRWAATAAAALALAASGATLGYMASQDSNRIARQSAIEHNATFPENLEIEVPTTDLTEAQRAITLGFGAATMAAGGLAGALLGLRFSGRIAHRRAKRIYHKHGR